MLPLSLLTIPFNKSRDYCCIAFLLYAFILVLLCYSHFSLIFIIPIYSLSLIPLFGIYCTRKPYPWIKKLTLDDKACSLYDINDNTISYKKIHVLLDTGFFMLIALLGDGVQKNLVIFHDQMSKEEYRMLRLFEKIQAKSQGKKKSQA